jgi:hypothetical protein
MLTESQQIAEAPFRYLPHSGGRWPIAEGYFRYWPPVQAPGSESHQLAENPFRYSRCHVLTAWHNGNTFPLFQLKRQLRGECDGAEPAPSKRKKAALPERLFLLFSYSEILQWLLLMVCQWFSLMVVPNAGRHHLARRALLLVLYLPCVNAALHDSNVVLADDQFHRLQVYPGFVEIA